MRVNCLMISYRLNFLAEAALKTIPAPVIVLHVYKTEKQLSEFKSPNALNWFPPIPGNHSHSTILNLLFSKSKSTYARLFDCDAIVFMDHDYFFPQNEFKSILSCFLDELAKGRMAAAIKHITKTTVFTTYPMFAVKAASIPIDWTPKTIDGDFYDTGQILGFSLHRAGLLGLIDHPKNGLHWESGWALNWGKPENTESEKRIIESGTDHYVRRIKMGSFNPGSADAEVIEEHILLKRAFAVCASTM